jgi:hypothetical protein
VTDVLTAQIIIAAVAAFFACLILFVFIAALRDFWFGWWR